MAILGKKIGMTQIFEDGKVVPVTVIEAGPNFVLQTKTTEKDGYVAIQVGFGEKKEKSQRCRRGGNCGGGGGRRRPSGLSARQTVPQND